MYLNSLQSTVTFFGQHPVSNTHLGSLPVAMITTLTHLESWVVAPLYSTPMVN